MNYDEEKRSLAQWFVMLEALLLVVFTAFDLFITPVGGKNSSVHPDHRAPHGKNPYALEFLNVIRIPCK